MRRRISFSRILTLMLMLFLLMIGVTEYTLWSIAKPAYVRTDEQIGELQHELTAVNKTIDSLQYKREQQLEELQPLIVVKQKGYSKEVGLTIIKESKNDDLKVIKVDVDEQPDLAGMFNVMSIPTLVLFKNGKMVGSKLGFMTEDMLNEWIKEAK